MREKICKEENPEVSKGEHWPLQREKKKDKVK